MIRIGVLVLLWEVHFKSPKAELFWNSSSSELTNLACNDWWVDNELYEFTEQLVQEADTGIKQSPFQCSHAGLQLPLHVGLGYDDILQAEGKGVLLQNIH